MNELSIQIIKDLPTYSDQEMRILYGRLTLNMYGAEVSNETAKFVINERNRRDILAQCEEVAA
tara:strand:- start:118 stop:306 length:189 start_codon:yes stop_codon:yes gene_type:complete